jgi:hypothetical protein
MRELDKDLHLIEDYNVRFGIDLMVSKLERAVAGDSSVSYDETRIIELLEIGAGELTLRLIEMG